MNYRVLTLDKPDWYRVPEAEISSYPWGGEYMPRSYGKCIVLRNQGIAIRMVCYEINPKAVYTNYNDPVYKDSCMEFFASFNPQSPLYMNFEMNSKGAFLSAVRVEKPKKTPIDQLIDISRLTVKPEIASDHWSLEVLFPFDIIETLFGKCTFTPGTSFRANFYKCGDETAQPHFGSFAPIDLPAPNFHCPQFFGNFIIEG